MKTKCLIIAKYDFVDKNGRAVKTTKVIASLGLYGFVTLCTPLLNDKPLLSEQSINLSIKDNKFYVDNVG